MTLIVGLYTPDRRLFVGADSGSFTDEGNVFVVAGGKLFRKGRFVVGCAGSPRFAEVFQFGFEPPEPPPTDPAACDAFMVRDFVTSLRDVLAKAGCLSKETSFEGDMIQAYSGSVVGVQGVGVYYLGADFSIRRPEPANGEQLTATGSGASFALGAMVATRSTMEPRPRIEASLKVTAELHNCVRPPYSIIEA